MASALQILQNTFGVRAIAPTDPGIIRLSTIRGGPITPALETDILFGRVPDPLAPTLSGIQKLAKPLAAIAPYVLNYFAPGAGTAVQVASSYAQQPGLTAKPLTAEQRSKMAYYDPTTGGWTDTPTSPAPSGSGSFGLSDIFGGASASDWLGLLNTGLNTFNAYQTNASAVRAVVSAAGTVVGPAAGGMVVGGARAVGRSLFLRFPNLAAGLNALKMAGKNYATRSRLYSLLKRFGPDVLITGGILSAAAVSELMIAGPGRRRMNPANVKALRRAHRRMASFHHICRKNDALMHRGGRRKSTARFTGTSITQVK